MRLHMYAHPWVCVFFSSCFTSFFRPRSAEALYKCTDFGCSIMPFGSEWTVILVWSVCPWLWCFMWKSYDSSFTHTVSGSCRKTQMCVVGNDGSKCGMQLDRTSLKDVCAPSMVSSLKYFAVTMPESPFKSHKARLSTFATSLGGLWRKNVCIFKIFSIDQTNHICKF